MATDQPARVQLAAQRDRFGGVNWGAAFFGWLSANGLAVFTLAIVSAAGVAIGYTTTAGDLEVNRQRAENGVIGSTETIGLAGGALALLLLAVSYYCGGYVAGRMSRFDGARQGLAVWFIGLLAVLALAAAGVAFGARYNVLARLDLPRIPVDEGTATRGAVVALVAMLLVTAVSATLGGVAGRRYHGRIDRAAFD